MINALPLDRKAEIAFLKARIRYFGSKRPDGWVLAHNWVRHTKSAKHGDNGFRVFYVPDPVELSFVPCACGWRPDLGPHFGKKVGDRR